jgi:mannose-6-phosphate isomerase-like protein (cupin superfamily)
MGREEFMNLGRREFLLAVPAGAAAGLAIANTSLFAQAGAPADVAQAQSGTDARGQLWGGMNFRVLTAQQIQDDVKVLESAPGDNNLVLEKSFKVVLTVEKAKSAAEFEWHEGRDHVFLILDGETIYEVGGTPKGAHSMGPGEWHAPESVGATTLTLKKGDMLVIPRGTLHKRSTPVSVTLYQISPQ